MCAAEVQTLNDEAQHLKACLTLKEDNATKTIELLNEAIRILQGGEVDGGGEVYGGDEVEGREIIDDTYFSTDDFSINPYGTPSALHPQGTTATTMISVPAANLNPHGILPLALPGLYFVKVELGKDMTWTFGDFTLDTK
nr:hypothetical protein Iba_chr01aCG5330 [Ipomoea batatas]